MRVRWIVGIVFLLGIPLGLLGIGYQLLQPILKESINEFETAIARSPTNTVLFDRHGQPFYTLRGLENRLQVPRTHPSRALQLSILAAEDARFFQHYGIDPIRIAGALWVNLQSGGYRQGASTLTQQMIKLMLLTPEKTLSRKLREAVLALALEQRLSKYEILEYYLNTIYLGHGNYGVEQAARAYFGKSSAALHLAEGALLAGIVRRPEYYLRVPKDASAEGEYYPQAWLENARARQLQVLRQLERLQWFSAEEIQAARDWPLQVRLPRGQGSGAYFAQQVVSEMQNTHDLPHVYGGGYRVFTTLDAELQHKAEEVVNKRFAQRDEQVALVSVDPNTGEVRALVGGKNFLQSQFNRATQAERQPGSAIKPVVYAMALEQGIGPHSVWRDEPLNLEWEDVEGFMNLYTPGNYDGKFGAEREMRGSSGDVYFADTMTLAKALEMSINTVAVQVLQRAGLNTFREFARQLSLNMPDSIGLCAALGCAETSLLTLTSAYVPFVQQGQFTPPSFIVRIEDPQGRVVYERPKAKPAQVMSEWTAFQMRNMLHGVLQLGTGRNANWSEAPLGIGGKTGTTSEYRDAWFVGFVPGLVTGVWMGYDDNRPMDRMTGGNMPARLWRDYAQTALPLLQGTTLPPEPEHVLLPTCTINGELATPDCPDIDLYAYASDDPLLIGGDNASAADDFPAPTWSSSASARTSVPLP